MPELNKANRQVCDVEIRDLKTKAPIMYFDTANTTTAGLTGDSVYAMAKGSRAIAFHNPIEGTLTCEAQVYPFKLFAMFSDGVIDSEATYAKHEKVTCATAGEVAVDADAVAGTVFVYAEGEYGATPIEGTFASGKFTASTASEIAVGSEYEVGCLVARTANVSKVSFNKNKVPKNLYITMNTLDKDTEGTLTPFIITAYKASIQRNFELSFSSEGDPASITITLN